MKYLNFDTIKKYPILEYARIEGFTPVKRGSEYTLKEHDSIVINHITNKFFRNSTGQAGSVIDFAMFCANNEISLEQAVERIKELQGLGDFAYEIDEDPKQQPSNEQKESVDKTLVLPERANNMRRTFAYLTKTRGIDADTVRDWARSGNLYQDVKGNCVFVSRDEAGNAVFASQRGTNTEKRFVADLAGSDYSKCFQINNTANTLVITESTIDLMSVQDVMKKKGRDLKDYNYMSINGVAKIEAVEQYVKVHPDVNNVVLAYDNDAAGIEAVGKTRELLDNEGYTGKTTEFLPPDCKDWNNQLEIYNAQQNQAAIMPGEDR